MAQRGEGTRLAILSLMLEHPAGSRQAMGDALGITAQAVSAQVADLRERGWLDGATGQPTPAGVQALSEGIGRFRRALDALQQPLSPLGAVSAQARCTLRAGQTVGLWMEQGDLIADDNLTAGSQGLVTADAAPGDEVIVQGLTGMVPLQPGTVTIARLPGPAEGGTNAIDAQGAQGMVPEQARVGAIGTGARIFAERTGRLDDAFGAETAARNAALRGVDTFLWVTSDRLAQVLEGLDEEGLKVRLIDVMEHEAPGN